MEIQSMPYQSVTQKEVPDPTQLWDFCLFHAFLGQIRSTIGFHDSTNPFNSFPKGSMIRRWRPETFVHNAKYQTYRSDVELKETHGFSQFGQFGFDVVWTLRIFSL